MNEKNNENETKEDGAKMDKRVTGILKKIGGNHPGGKSSKRGMYTAAVSALVVAIVIVFNLIVGGLPAGTLEYDITGHNVYTVTEQSVNYLKTLDKDVSIVVLAQDSAIDKRVSKFINNYARLSSHITLKIIDPVLDPTALTTYNAKENNIVVSCAATNKTKILDLAGIEGYQAGLILYDAQAYQSGQLQAVALDAEGQLTSAVSYVTSTETNKMYLLSGHGEASLGTNATSLISKANIETTSLNLLTDGNVPSDCELIVCFNPTQDLANDELTTLEAYLKTGGNVLLILDNTQLKNFNALLTTYGLQMQNGYIGDNDRFYKALNAQYGIYCIYPVLSTSDDITASITTDALLRGARGMLQVMPERRGSVVTPFMTTSENGLLADSQNNGTQGQYIIGATAVETFTDQKDTESRLTVITAVDLLSDDIAANVGPTDLNIFMNAVDKNYTQVQSLVVPEKTLNVTPIQTTHPGFWSAIFIGVIPVGVLACGFIYWVRRRNR
jgi:ABC-2 type transport system permease protein